MSGFTLEPCAEVGNIHKSRLKSRRIVGEYCLTVDDYLARRSFDDEISRNCYFIDIHQNSDDNKGCQDYDSWKAFTTGCSTVNGISARYQPGESHGIPYRCLVPKGFKNLLVAGRSISCDRRVQASIRVMPVAMAMGEAAGMAAATLAMKNITATMDIDMPAFRQALKKRQS